MGNIECGILRIQRKDEGTGGNTNTENNIKNVKCKIKNKEFEMIWRVKF